MRTVSLIVLAAAALATACGSRAASGSSDSSFDRIEELRAMRAADGGDHRYDRIEELRTDRLATTTVYVWDDSYDKLEAHRLSHGK